MEKKIVLEKCKLCPHCGKKLEIKTSVVKADKDVVKAVGSWLGSSLGEEYEEKKGD